MSTPDVVVIGAGADGPACAARLARKHGLDVLILEAGPWHGNDQWPEPHSKAGGTESSSPTDLNGKLLDEQLTALEAASIDRIGGMFRLGPANLDRPPWMRTIHQNALTWHVNAVGGTSLSSFNNYPRAYPHAINEQDHWPIDYEELVPYYQHNEMVTNVQQAPITAKHQPFLRGAEEVGFERSETLNVTDTGYRPLPNAITAPPEELNAEYDGSFSYEDGFRGNSLIADEFMGSPTPTDAPVDEKARKSSNVSWVPRALAATDEPEMGNVAIRPNTAVTTITIEGGEATGVEYRNTWSGDTGTVTADVVVLAAGTIESPRLWLNSGLPDDGWVGKGLTTHWFDWIVGVFPDDVLKDLTGQPEFRPYAGDAGAVMVDKPGTGCIKDATGPAGVTSLACYLLSQAGYSFDTDVDPDEPWDGRGYLVGTELKRKMARYKQTTSLFIYTDDLPRQSNGVTLDSGFSDEHGPVAQVSWTPHPDDSAKRDELARMGAHILRAAGAEYVHRVDWAPLLTFAQSSLGMGRVLDANAEAKNVPRLFVADHSALPNCLGGPAPTNTGQALALRTADRIAQLYFQ
ncbi:GMC family oxidoreductase N-terminal domain-containing protein [Halocatena halophila]|uniref:GMC family oxidoreductase N-terminal domain-containing protein n=1 Tax=Halocatena halophila TaxID=2814576 RepID=UPI002ED3B220